MKIKIRLQKVVDPIMNLSRQTEAQKKTKPSLSTISIMDRQLLSQKLVK